MDPLALGDALGDPDAASRGGVSCLPAADAEEEAVGVAEAVLDAFTLALGEAVGLVEDVAELDGVALGVGTVGTPAPVASTGRKVSCAVWFTLSSRSPWSLPGTDTTMVALLPDPWRVISASATPLPLTRWRMMSIAWSMSALVTWPWPLAACGMSVTLVPPCRSSPSLGLW